MHRLLFVNALQAIVHALYVTMSVEALSTVKLGFAIEIVSGELLQVF